MRTVNNQNLIIHGGKNALEYFVNQVAVARYLYHATIAGFISDYVVLID